jgi:thiamine biosynthesis protein ThiI
MRKVLLVRFGEVHLKGLNRPYFFRKLLDHVRLAVRGIAGQVWLSDGRIYVGDVSDMEECGRRVSRVFGVHSVSPAWELEKDYDKIADCARDLVAGRSGRFKVKARRSDKRFPMDSPEICKRLGQDLCDANPALQVDVHDPELVVQVEIRDMAYVYADTLMGPGGMPMGTNGKACLLLSGGIDSPVAGYMTAKRGVELCCVYFHSFPYTSERAQDKVVSLAKILSEYCVNVRLFVVPFTDIQMRIHKECPEDYTTLIMRRYMMRIAERIAREEGAQALVTGESIGQVASQTMEAIGCTDAVVNLPVFRPLIGFDKLEIIQRAQAIGTFETSSLPYEDCCTIFTPKHPVTHPRLHLVEQAESVLPVAELVEAAVAGAECIELPGTGAEINGALQ